MTSDDNDLPLKPLTFKVPKFMYEQMESLVEDGQYESRAELIRFAIQKLIDWELNVESISDSNFKF